jgi:hypothetical protein
VHRQAVGADREKVALRHQLAGEFLVAGNRHLCQNGIEQGERIAGPGGDGLNIADAAAEGAAGDAAALGDELLRKAHGLKAVAGGDDNRTGAGGEIVVSLLSLFKAAARVAGLPVCEEGETEGGGGGGGEEGAAVVLRWHG